LQDGNDLGRVVSLFLTLLMVSPYCPAPVGIGHRRRASAVTVPRICPCNAA